MRKFTLIPAVFALTLGMFLAIGLGYAKPVKAAAPPAGIFDGAGNRLVTFPNILPGSSIAAGDVDNDGIDEVIVGSPPGVAATVTLYKQNATLIRTFAVFNATLRSGIHVSFGVMKGSGEARIMVTARNGGPPLLYQYRPTGEKIEPTIGPYLPSFHGGVYAAYGDVDGDGITEIITMPGPGIPAQMKRYTVDGHTLWDSTYLASVNQDSRCGTSLTTGDADLGINHGDGYDEVYFAKSCPLTPGLDQFDYRYAINHANNDWFQSMLVGLDTGGPTINLRRIGQQWVMVTGHHYGSRTYIQYTTREDFIRTAPIFYPFPDTWLGGASAVSIGRDGTGALGLVIVPGDVTLPAKELQNFVQGPFSGPVKNYITKYADKRIATSSGNFRARYVQVNLRSPKVRITTAQALAPLPAVTSLKNLMLPYKAIAAINGGIMTCDARHILCRPGVTAWYDTAKKKFNPNVRFNRFTFVFDSTNRWYYFGPVNQVGNSDGIWFGTNAFQVKNNTQLTAAFGNGVTNASTDLLQAGQVIPSKRTGDKARRSVFGVKGDEAFFVVVENANAYDVALVMKGLGVEYATLLDGGGSSALYYNGQYKVGPGRNIANAIVIGTR